MMGFRQVYKAAGLEHYQDKIQLSKDQRKVIIYTENYRGMKPHSVCSLRCSYCPGYTESYFRQSVGGSTSLPAVAVTARTFNNVVSAFPKSFSPLMTRILTCDPPFVILNLRGDLMWRKPLTFAVHKVSLWWKLVWIAPWLTDFQEASICDEFSVGSGSLVAVLGWWRFSVDTWPSRFDKSKFELRRDPAATAPRFYPSLHQRWRGSHMWRLGNCGGWQKAWSFGGGHVVTTVLPRVMQWIYRNLVLE